MTISITHHVDLVAKACRLIEAAENPPTLEELARMVGLSPFHFQRIFTRVIGLSPKAYAVAHRATCVRQQLPECSSITKAIYESGYNSNSRFYAESNRNLGMTPKAFRAGGSGATIRFAVGQTSIGSILVAASQKGICAVFLGDDPVRLTHDLQDRFPKAHLIGADGKFEKLVARVVGLVENPSLDQKLPLDIRGTAFQQRVWRALTQIPLGQTATYADIARRIGRPKAVRAVAGACGANPVAVAIPCHRVIRTDGGISGYRWGIERKRALLQKERGFA